MIYLRLTNSIGYRRLTRMMLLLYGLQTSEGAVDAVLQRAKPCFDDRVSAILARLRRSRIVCSDETTARIDGRTHRLCALSDAVASELAHRTAVATRVQAEATRFGDTGALYQALDGGWCHREEQQTAAR